MKPDKVSSAGTTMKSRAIDFGREAVIGTIDNVAMRTLEQAVRFYGIRAVLFALKAIAERCAEQSVENFNTVQAKQWAAWAVELEAICGSSKLKDPGRD